MSMNLPGRWAVVAAILAARMTNPHPLAAEEPVRLQERFTAGYQYHVRTRVDLAGTLTPPAEKGKPAPKPVTINGNGAIEYDERVLDLAKSGEVIKTARLCRRTEIRRTLGGQPQSSTLRPEV